MAETEYAKAVKEFLEDEETKRSLDITTLTPGPYQENRLIRAFRAGWNARSYEAKKRST